MRTFLQWIDEQEQKPEGSPLVCAATHSRTTTPRERDRDRLTRMEAMLKKLMDRSANANTTN